MDLNIKVFSALSNACQLGNCLIDNSTVDCVIDDGASDDRAIECCISNHYHHNSRRRRRLVAVEGSVINSKFMYVHKCLTYNCLYTINVTR